MKVEEKIQKQLAENPIILYMKGTPSNPQCGFSGKAVTILKETGIPYAFVNVLEAPFIREKLPKISHWPTYPQLFVNGELVGGCDIIESMSKQGSLIPLLQSIKTTETEQEGLTNTQVEDLVKRGFSDGQIFVEGTGCDLTVTVISDQFTDLTEVKKQQLVMKTLNEPLSNGKLHAVTVKTFTLNEWQARSANSASGLLQIAM